jgi:hypothetical protein
MDLANELERLHALFLSGAMTAEEYQQAKAKLLAGEDQPEAANDNPAPFDWENVGEQSPAGEVPNRAAEVTEKDVLRALEAGAIGGGIIGIPLSLATEAPFGLAVIGAALAGAIVWSTVSLGVKATARSRGFGSSLLRLLYGAAIVAYGLALLFVVGFAIYVKSHLDQPRPELSVPPAVKLH